MLPEKRVLSFLDASRKPRSPLTGTELPHQRPLDADALIGLGSGLKAKDLIGLLMGHWPARRAAPPRCRIGLRVLTPTGIPAVKIRCL